MKKKVAFICVHNSCRSQMAEAIGNHLYGDYLECYSAGTELKDQINQDAVRIVKELYGIDMNAKGHHSKLIDEIPDPDISHKLQAKNAFLHSPFPQKLYFLFLQP